MDITSMPTNQSWKLRSKHGRSHLFKTPEGLWDAACIYFEWCDQNPIYKDEVRGREIITVMKMRAYTLRGLCLHLGCGINYFSQFERQLAGKVDEESEEFRTIISLIRDAIYDQKFTGAAAGALNANLISRDLGLMNKPVINDTLPADFVPPKPRSVVVWGEHEIPI